MKYSKRTLSVAPMMDWTDRHCRVFHRQITRHTWLYTEMVTTGADRRTSYLALIAKTNRTADEEGKIKQYLEYSKGNDAALRAIGDKLFGKIKQDQDDAEKKFTEQANNVIIDVAKKKGLKVVVRKRALVWSADEVDITKDVLAQLNK